ncbi:alpha/beta fold hydrolase [Sphingomonas sp. RT2P30]|uniref:S9 family peptidase n=1 Tax=Parasphingomonas halimpatiens TaxID=3096162 RepID=UPI002FC91FB7
MKSRKVMLLLAAAYAWTLPADAQVKASTEWAQKVVPIEVFAQFPMIDDPRITPDGKWIAAKIRAGGEQVLAILAVGQAGMAPMIIAHDGDFSTDKQGEQRISSYRWVDSDHLLIAIASRDNYAGQWFDNMRYASYNRATKKVTALGWDKAFTGTEVLWTSHTGAPHLLLQRRNLDYGTELANFPEVIDVDMNSGTYKTAMRPNPLVSGWDADSDGVVRLGSSQDSDTGKLRVLYRPDAGTPMRTIVNDAPDRYDGVPLPAMFLSGSAKAYAYSRKDGFRALYEYDLATMQIGKRVFGVPGYDIDGAQLSPDRTHLDGVAFTQGREGRVFFDPRLKEIQTLLEETYGKGNVQIASADAPREKIVFRVAAMGQAQSWYVFDTVSGGIGRIAYDNDTLKDALLNPVSVVHYPASDGKSIEAILTMPRHRAGQKNLPLVVLPHGGPWARDSADWDPYGWAQALAEQGYVVIQPNYRGSTGYGRDWEKASENAWGYRMQDDLNDAITWLAGQGTVDAKRVCMFGWSYGGYAASRAAERDGDKYRCAISGAGVHDLTAMIRYDKNYLGRYGAKMGMGSASANLVDASPGLHPEKYSIPILIIQGAKDVRVPPAQSRELVARLKRAGKVEGRDFVYIEQPLNTHNLLREPDRVQVLQEVSKFLQAHNPA